MKILIITAGGFKPSMHGLYEHNLLSMLENRGHDVKAITLFGKSVSPSVESLYYESSNWKKVFFDVFSPRVFSKILSWMPDVIQTNGLLWSSVPLQTALFSKVVGIPVVLTTHSPPEWEYPGLIPLSQQIPGGPILNLIFGIRSIAVFQSKRVICLSHKEKEVLKSRFHFPAEGLDVIPNSVDLERFDRLTPTSERRNYKTQRTLLYVGQ